MAFVSAIVAYIGITGTAAAVATFVGKAILSYSVSKLLANRAGKQSAGTMPSGSRQQLPPATDNKLPVVYGTGFVGPSITDAKISTDQKTMWYVCSFAECTDTTVGSAYTFDQIYYDGKLVTFGTGGDAAKVVSLTTNATTPQVDTKVAGSLYIYLFTNGSSSGVNTGGQSAIDIMSDASIPSDQRWNSTLYTASGQSAQMTNSCFAIVKIIYNQEAGTTGIGTVQAKLTNSLTKPGAVLLDYLQNTRYGCAVPLAQIDTASLTALDTYSDGLIDYTDTSGNPATQVRYRINGPIDTGSNCLDNLQQLVDACDSWLQYSELSGKWKVVINQSYTDYTTLANLFEVNDENIIGQLDVTPVDLNGTYNQLEVQYPNTNIKDQIDNCYVDLFTEYPSLLNANEPVNKLIVQFSIVNNFVQAKYLGIRRLLQSREDLVITFATDYSGIVVDAGDVIKVTNATYGWTNKLFRVSNVNEEKYPDGSLGTRMTAFEYNDTIYDDDLDITDFVPEDNTGIDDVNVIGTPNCPSANLNVANTIAVMTITGTVPTPGLVMNMDFNYGNTSNSANHIFYKTVSGNGTPLVANSNVSITSTDLPTGNWYFSVTARNQFVGVRSSSCPNTSFIANWTGPTVTEFNSNANVGGITGNNVQANSVNGNRITSGTITILQLDSNITNLLNSVESNIGNFYYDICDLANTQVVMPINAAANTARNVPIYFAGTSVNANNIYPYYQGTSTTTGGTNGNNWYAANSTSSFNPYLAAVLIIADGDDNWYTLISVNTAGNLSTGDQLINRYSYQLVSDSNCTVQIVNGIQFNPSIYFNCVTTQMTTIDLVANQPYFGQKTQYWRSGSIANVWNTSVFIRCTTGGANLISVAASMYCSKTS